MLNHQLAVVEVGILEVRLAMETLAPMEPHLQVRRRALRCHLQRCQLRHCHPRQAQVPQLPRLQAQMEFSIRTWLLQAPLLR